MKYNHYYNNQHENLDFEHNLLLSNIYPQKYPKVSVFTGKYLVLPHQVLILEINFDPELGNTFLNEKK